MNKTDLVNVVAAAVPTCDKKDVAAVIGATLDAVVAALKDGDKVQLIGFGTFEAKDVAAHDARNPSTGETVRVEACKKPVFSASKALKDALNAPAE